MRFLCLHGMGTNSKIFEIQTARIRAALGSEHEYVFIDGSITADPAPGVREIAATQTSFFRFAEDDDVSSALDLYEDLEDLMTQGESASFDGIIGFSEGGAVAASLLAYHEQMVRGGQASPFGFKCGIFFCAGPPCDAVVLKARSECVELEVPEDSRALISCPTAHAYDLEDDMHPGFGVKLPTLCRQEVMETYTHKLGHMVPGTQSDEGLKETVRIIRRTIDRVVAGGQ